MPLECPQCLLQSDVVYYRRPARSNKQLRWLKILLWVTTVASFISVGQLVGQLTQSTIQAAALSVWLGENPDVGGEEAGPFLRDGIRVYRNTAFLLFLGAAVGFLSIPIRYTILILRIKKAHPATLRKIRFLAWVQTFVQYGSLVAIAAIFGQNEVLKVSPSLGLPGILAPIIILYTRRPGVKRFFSAHKVEMAPEFTKGPVRAAGPPAGPPPRPAPTLSLKR